MSFGTTPVSTTSLSTNQFPVSAVAVPNEAGGNLTALEGGPESTDTNGNKTAPASVYIKDGGDVTQGTSTDANTASTVMGRLTKIRDLLNATLTVGGTLTETNSTSIKSDLDAINTAIGAISDAAWSGSGDGSEIAILKKIVAELAATLTVSGTVTANAGSGSFTVAQATGSNLHTVLDSGSTTAVTQATGTNLHTVVDSGTVTANAGTGTFTNQQSNVTADYDSGAGTQNLTMFGVALPASGGAVSGGTSTNPIRTDPTGTTTQPVSGTVTVQQATAANLKVDLSGTSANSTAIKTDGSGVTQPVSGTVTANAGTGSFTVTQATGSNLHAVLDAGSAVIGHVIADSGSTTAVTQVTASNLNAQVQGAAASGASNAGNPVKDGGVFNTTQPTVTNGQVVDAQYTARGAAIVATGVDAFAVNASQSGTWNVNNVSGTVSLPTGAATSAKQPALGTAGSASSDVITIQGVASMTAVKVDGSAVTQPVSGTVTANQGGSNWTTNTVQLNGTTVDTNSGNKSAGTQRIVLATDQPQLTNALKVDGSGVTQPVSGTVTANAGTGTFTNQQSNITTDYDTGAGTQTMTMFGLALPASGGAVAGGTSSNPVQVSLANTAANSTAVKVDGSAVTQPVSGTVSITANSSVNVAQVAGTTTDTNSGNKSAGTQRVVLATDQPQLTNALKVDGSGVTQPVSGTVSITANSAVNVAQINGVTTSMGNGVSGTGVQRVTIASDSTGQVTLASGANTIGSLTANQSVNVAQIAGSATSTAATGVQKVGIVGNSGATVDSTIGAGIAPTNAVVTGTVYNSSAPAPTSGQAMALQADQAGNTRIFPGIALAALSAWNSGTSLNATQTIFSNSGAEAVLVQLTQTTTLTAGAVTFEVNYDGSNWSTIPASAVLDPTSTTFAQISLPYTVQASTNKQFLLNMNGAQGLRIKLSTQITGSGTVTPNYALLPASPADTVIALSPTAANFNVTASAGTNLNTSLLALESGGNLATLAGAVSSAKVQANVAQLAGTTTDTNSGNKSAGTLRVVMATDQPALTNAQPSNITQVSGSSIATGNNALPVLNSAATGYVSAYGSNAAALTSSTDYSFKWGAGGTTQVNHIMLQNNTTANLNFDLDVAANAGSPILAPGQTIFFDVQTSILHLFQAGTPNVNGSSAGNIVVRGWL